MDVKLVIPTYEQIEYTKHLWMDELTMADVGGTHSMPDEKWKQWYEKMVMPSDGMNKYFQIFDGEHAIGEISFHRYNSETGIADLNIKIENCYRGHGYGRQAFLLFKDFFFNEIGGRMLRDEVTSASGKIFLSKLGFKLKSINGEVSCFELTR